eukprot:gene28302-22807_t
MRSLILLSTVLLASGERHGTPGNAVPAGFDCKTRHLAMEYEFDTLADVINMHGGGPGGVAQCFNVTYD